MPRSCNIDARGKTARLAWGILMVALGIILMAAWARGSGSWLRWGVSGAAAGSGLFALYEAWAGWCVVRALGIRTWI